jgi:hypothetical protein
MGRRPDDPMAGQRTPIGFLTDAITFLSNELKWQAKPSRSLRRFN